MNIELFALMLLIIFIFIGFFLLLYSWIQKSSTLPKKRRKENPTVSIIIPARDESKVIRGLLDSIAIQSVKVLPENVYIVVESKDDKTCEIVKEYGMNIVFREDLSKARKGYAIDDALKHLSSINKKYDMYFIFDADNILDKDFIKNMIVSYLDGYDIAVGYRNTKNGNDSVVAAASSLTFTMINTLFNKRKAKKNLGVTISGTGFYISGEVIRKLDGYPFNTLTEDYELSVYSVLNNISSTYNEKAIFYDEQPIKYNVTKVQRTRWIRGYIDVRKKYHSLLKEKSKDAINREMIAVERLGVIPFIIMVIGLFTFIFINIFMIGVNIVLEKSIIYNIIGIISLIIIVYTFLAVITFIMIKKEKEYFGLSKKMKIKAIFYNPIFLVSYIPCAIKALFSPNLGWKRIEHNK